MNDDGDFVPFDLLHRPAGSAGDLDDAEHALETIGLTLLAQTYELTRDGRTMRVGIKELNGTRPPSPPSPATWTQQPNPSASRPGGPTRCPRSS